jgi:para-nitrobenzyl esterase
MVNRNKQRAQTRMAALLAAAPLFLAACGGSSETPSGSASGEPASSSSGAGGSTSSSSGSASGGAAGSGGGGASSGTGGSSPGAIDPTYIEELTLPSPSSPPGFPDVTVYLDVAYGTDPSQRFDIVLPKSATPTPLLIHIHGGGFVGGDKAITNSPQLQQTVGGGVAYASLNYRLLAEVDKEGVIKPLTDCKRALQFIRYHAAKLNVDPARVAVKGGSAGAGTSLWIGLHDDMAGSGDEVDKMSTRVLGVAANATQATYDLMKWETVVFAEFGLNLLETVEAQGMEQRLLSFYGMDSLDELESPNIKAYRAKVDMFAHMSADDPPVYVHNTMMTTAAPADQNELFHHAAHAKAVEAQGTSAGVDVTAVIEAYGVDESGGQNEWTFLVSKLKP